MKGIIIILVVGIILPANIHAESFLEALQKDLENIGDSNSPIEAPQAEPESPGIIIYIQDSELERDVVRALTHLRDEFPEMYQFVDTHTDSIVVGGYGSSVSWTKTIKVNKAQWFRHPMIWRVSCLLHEAGHSKLYWDWMNSHPNTKKHYAPQEAYASEKAEDYCMSLQLSYLRNFEGNYKADHYIKFVVGLMSEKGNNHSDMNGDGKFDSEDVKLLEELARTGR